VVLANDPVCEIECGTYLAGSDISLHVTRVANPDDFSPEALVRLEPRILGAVGALLPDDRIDCIALACASAASAIGRPRLRQLIEERRPGVFLTDPGLAAIETMRAAGIRRISLLLTPTDPKTNAMAVQAYEEAGFEVLKALTCGLSTDRLMSTARLDFIRAALEEVDDPKAEAIFVPCTALRTWLAVESLPSELRTRLLTGNQALMSHAKAVVLRGASQR
jgi:maleate isomerase